MTSAKDIGFKDSRKTTAWQRVAVFADGSIVQAAASSANFTINGTKASVGLNYTVSANITFTDDKTVTVHYGSVNSGSDMGEIVSGAVSDNCVKATITYSYLTNLLSKKLLGAK